MTGRKALLKRRSAFIQETLQQGKSNKYEKGQPHNAQVTSQVSLWEERVGVTIRLLTMLQSIENGKLRAREWKTTTAKKHDTFKTQ